MRSGIMSKKMQVIVKKFRKIMLYKEGTPKIPEKVLCFYTSASYSSIKKFTKVIASNSEELKLRSKTLGTCIGASMTLRRGTSLDVI